VTARGVGRGIADPDVAVRKLFDAEYQPMYRLAFTMLASDAAAEDVVQEAFLAVAARWASLTNPGGYLRTTVVNGARKRWRSESSRALAEGRAALTERYDAPDGGYDLLHAVDRLPERQRLAVILTYYAELNSTEVSEIMGCEAVTVRSLVRRALEQLAKVVER
jgi:RNA polymerase sigma factor (sigma-70 family)